MPPAVTARGITAVSLGYRLAPILSWPAGFDELADGVAQVAALAGEFGANPTRIFVPRHSAAGHLGAMLALRTDW